MANNTGDGNRVGPDLKLPEQILSVIPTDPYEQLDLARKLTSMAIASRVTNLETEASGLRKMLQEKDSRIDELENKVSHLETAYQDAESRLKASREDNVKLVTERDSLALTAKKLSRDLAKLETFKKQLMQSLNDENSPKTETVDIGTCDQSVTKAFSRNGSHEESNGYSKSHSYVGSTDTANDDVSKQSGQILSMAPYITPRLTPPTATPKVISASITPRYSAAATPNKTSGATTPTNQYDRSGSLSAWYPSSQQSSAANSPPRRPLVARTPRIDGKEFFRQARSRLSLEQFSAFLANIKELNAQRQSREETLRKAEEIFGFDNKDLFISFQGLLSRNMQ